MDEKLKRAGDQFARRHPGASSVLGGIIDISYEEQEYTSTVLRTGILSLDFALGGGLPSGIIEIHGDESTGKTALVGAILASAQRSGLSTALCPTEYFDAPYLEKLGVDMHQLALVKGFIDGVGPVLCDFVGSARRLAVIDSLTALRPQDEAPENWNEKTFEFLSGALSRCGPNSMMVVTNQSRVKRSMRPEKVLGRGTETAARRLTDFFKVRLELSRANVHLKEYTMVVNIEANVLARPAMFIELPVRKGYGIMAALDTLRVGLHLGAIDQAGSRYYFNGEELGHGELDAAETLAASGLMWSLQDAILR